MSKGFMFRTAIIGVSGFGRIHFDDLMRGVAAGRFCATAATVVNQAEEAEKCARLRAAGCALFTDAEAMLAAHRGGLDLCMIPTGIHLHKPMTIAALRAGANVFVEKPAAATVQAVAAMAEAAREAKRFVAVGFQNVYATEMGVMKAEILEGRIGTLRSIRCRGLWPRSEAYYSRNNWAGRFKVGEEWVLDSPFNNAIAHQLNMLLYLAGPDLAHAAIPDWIEAELYRANEIEGPDTAAMRIMTAGNVPLYFFVTHCPEGYLDPEILVEGSRGRIHWTFHKCRIERGDGAVLELTSDSFGRQRERIMETLYQRLSGQNVPICDLTIAGVHTLVVNGAHDSSQVQVIDGAYRRREPHKESMRTVIQGIDGAIERGYREGMLFSEQQLAWARPGQRIRLDGYTQFPQRCVC